MQRFIIVFSTVRSRFVARVLGDLLTGERGVKRFQLAGFAIGANMISKALGFLVLIYSTRVALEQLGAQRFGVWVTISTIATLLGFMDLGVSNALIGRVAALNSQNRLDARLVRIVSGGLLTLLGLGFVIGLLLVMIFFLAPLTAWFRGIPGLVAEEARVTGYLFAVCFGLSLAAQGVFKVYIGIQQAWIGHLVSACGWVTSIILLSFAPNLEAPMWFYLFATYGIQQLFGCALSIGLLRRGLIRKPKNLMLGIQDLKGDGLLAQGQMFFVIQIAYAIGWGANQFILSYLIGPAEAASFSVLQRLFMIVQVALTILNLPLWAMYADAFSHEEIGFVRGLLKRSMLTTLLCSIIGVVALILVQRVAVAFLSGHAVDVRQSSVLLMAAWTVVEACGIAFSMYLNGIGRVRPQAITGLFHTIIGLPVKILAVRYFGMDGLIVAMVGTYLFFSVIPLLTLYRSECFRGIVSV